MPSPSPCPVGGAAQIALMHAIFPPCGLGGTKRVNRPNAQVLRGAEHPCFGYEMGVTCRLTGQGQLWEVVLK